MKPPSDAGPVVASRIFERDDGIVRLELYQPAPWPHPDREGDPDWRCAYSIEFPDGLRRQRSSAGVDALQALLLAIESAWIDLRYLGDGTPARRPPLRWLGMDDLGLAIRDLDSLN